MELPGLSFVRDSLETCLKFHKAGFWAQTKRAVIIIFIVLNLTFANLYSDHRAVAIRLSKNEID